MPFLFFIIENSEYDIMESFSDIKKGVKKKHANTTEYATENQKLIF